MRRLLPQLAMRDARVGIVGFISSSQRLIRFTVNASPPPENCVQGREVEALYIIKHFAYRDLISSRN